MNDTLTRSDFLTTVTLLACASAVLVGLARVLMERCAAARWRSIIGRTALLSIAAVVFAELTGGLVPLQTQLTRVLVRAQPAAPQISTAASSSTADASPLSDNEVTQSDRPSANNSERAEHSDAKATVPQDEPITVFEDAGQPAAETREDDQTSVPPVDAPLAEMADDQVAVNRTAGEVVDSRERLEHDGSSKELAEGSPESDEYVAVPDRASIVEDRLTSDSQEEANSLSARSVSVNSQMPTRSLEPVSSQESKTLASDVSAEPSRWHWLQNAWWRGLLVVWLVGWMTLVLRAIVVRILWSWRHRQAVLIDDEELQERVRAIGAQLGYRRRVSLKASSHWQGPVAWGVVLPTIGLPDDFCLEFDAEQQDAMLAHELGHLAARDPLWLLAADIVTAALWWTPWCWWLRANLRRSAETAADEACLVLTDGPRILAECLVVLGQRMTRPSSFGYAATGGFRSSLGQRVKRLLELEHGASAGSLARSPSQNQIVAVRFALVISVIVAMVGAAWARPGQEHSIQKEGKPMSWFDSTWRKSLLGSLVAMTLVTGNAPVGDTGVASAEEPQEATESKQEGEEKEEAAEEKEDEEAEATAEVADEYEASEDEASDDDDEDTDEEEGDQDEDEEDEEDSDDEGDDESDDEEEEADEESDDEENDADAEEAVRLEAEARAEAIREQIEEELEAKVAEIQESAERSTEHVVDEIAMLADRMAQQALVKADEVAAQADEIAELAAKKAEEAIARASEYLEEKEGSEKEEGEKAIAKGREKVKELKERIKSKSREKMAGRKKRPTSHDHESGMQARKARMSDLEKLAMQLEKQRLQVADQMESLARQQEKISMEIERVHKVMSDMHEWGPNIDTSELESVADYLDEQRIHGHEIRWAISLLHNPMGGENDRALELLRRFADSLRSNGKKEEARRLDDAIDSVMVSIKAQHPTEEAGEMMKHHQHGFTGGEEVNVLRQQMEAMRAEMEAMRKMLQQQAEKK